MLCVMIPKQSRTMMNILPSVIAQSLENFRPLLRPIEAVINFSAVFSAD
jgi:hypothetical protein